MYPDAKDEVVQLHLDDIIPNRFQPREVFDEKALKELAVSIKEHGVIQPIIVRSVANGKYEIIAGERRYKASALAGLTKIPAIIRDLDDKESSKVALLENLQRKNLTPIEEARTYQKILEIDEMTQEELAKTMGKSQSAVANKIRLLSLPEEVQEALLKEQISERHARTLLNIPDQKKQKEMLKKVIDTKMSVRALEDEINKEYPKANEDKKDEHTEINNTFINNSPLTPTAEMPVDESNYGKVTIAPPDEGGESSSEEEPKQKFINFGEIEKEEQEEEEKNTFTDQNEVPKVDITSITEKAENLNNNDTGNAALDSLLSFGNPNMAKSTADNSNFITPAEKIVKNDEKMDSLPTEESSDYFKTPDLVSLQLPQAVINPGEQNKPDTTANYTVDEAMNKIRELADDLRKHGIKINTDEMNFDKNYQIIIKIDKS